MLHLNSSKPIDPGGRTPCSPRDIALLQALSRNFYLVEAVYVGISGEVCPWKRS